MIRSVWSVPYSLVVILERPGILALLYVMFSCVYVTFTYGVLGQVWYFIPDLCFIPTLCRSSYTIIWIRKMRADCFALSVFLMSCDSRCSFAHPEYPGLEVIKREFILKVKIKHNDMCTQAVNHCALF